MKIAGLTGTHGGRTSMTLGWRDTLYFADPAPARERLVVLDLPGFEAYVPAATAPRGFDEDADEDADDDFDEDLDEEDVFGGIVPTEDVTRLFAPLTRYLAERGAPGGAAPAAPDAAGKRKKRREVVEIPAGLWRYAGIDDFLDSAGAESFLWHLAQHFPAEAFEGFARRHGPDIADLLAGALEKPAGEERLRALDVIRPRVGRAATIIGATPQCLQKEVIDTRKRLDRALVREAKRAAKQRTGSFTLSVEAWLEIIPRLKTQDVVAEAARFLGKDLAKRAENGEQVLAALERLAQVKKVRDVTQYDEAFWEPLRRFLRFEGNVTGETLDLAEAREETAQMNWDLLKARRVGTITPGRAVLVLHDKTDYSVRAYVQGERKLLFQIRKAGGRLERFGCTLTLPVDDDTRRMAGFLLDVEKIDALASLDPQAALAHVPAVADLPADHAVRRAAADAGTDYRRARALADLLIELHTGVDAEVIRQMARAQGRGGRRRR